MNNVELHAVYFYRDSKENWMLAKEFLEHFSKYIAKLYIISEQEISAFNQLAINKKVFIWNSDIVKKIADGIFAEKPDQLLICSDEAMGFTGDTEKVFERIRTSESCCACASERSQKRECFSPAFFSVSMPQISKRDLCKLLDSAHDNRLIFGNTINGKIDWFCDTSFWLQFTDRPMLVYPHELIQAGCPVFLKSVFLCDYEDTLKDTNGETAYELFEKLKSIGYNSDTLLEYLIRNLNQADLQKILHLNYILPTHQKSSISPIPEIALVMHLYYEDMLDIMYQYALSIPETADLYITTTSAEKAEIIKNKFIDFKCRKLEVRVIPNRGRDVSSIIIGVADVVFKYKYVCFVHDKKSTQNLQGTVGQSFGHMLLENTLGTKDFVFAIIQLFEKEPRLGLLSPPAPNHSNYYPVLGFEWGYNFENCIELSKRIGVHCSMVQAKEPVAPFGTCFWFRPEAFRLFYDAKFSYNDFPPEPNGIDATILHAFERVYSFVPQQLGFYPATVMTDRYARIEVDNIRHYVRTLNRVMFHGFREQLPFIYLKQYLINLFEQEEQKEQNEKSISVNTIYYRRNMRLKLKKLLPKWMYMTILRLKRFILGPRNKKVTYDD